MPSSTGFRENCSRRGAPLAALLVLLAGFPGCALWAPMVTAVAAAGYDSAYAVKSAGLNEP